MKKYFLPLFFILLLCPILYGFSAAVNAVLGIGNTSSLVYNYTFDGNGTLSSDWKLEYDESGGNTTVIRQNDVGILDIAYQGIQAHIYIWQSDSLPNDQTETVQLIGGSASAQNRLGACGRFTINGSQNGYCFYQKLDDSVAEILRYDSGVPNQLTYTTSPAQSISADSIVKIVFNGSSITAYVDNVQILNASDATYGSGYGGILYTSNSADMTIDNATGQ